MPSKLDVVNQALNALGRLSVTTIEDNESATLISQKLDVLLPELLLRTDWNFALGFVNDYTPIKNEFTQNYPNAYGFQYAFQLPANFNRMDRFNSSLCYFYRIIDGFILTNQSSVSYWYVRNDVDYAVLPPLFYRCLSLYAAAESCLPVTEDERLSAYLNSKYEQKMIDAIKQNDMDRMVVSTPFNDFNRNWYI